MERGGETAGNSVSGESEAKDGVEDNGEESERMEGWEFIMRSYFSPEGPTQFHPQLTKGSAKMESDVWIKAWVPKVQGHAALHS